MTGRWEIRVLHVLPSRSLSYGGPVHALEYQRAGLEKRGVRISVLPSSQDAAYGTRRRFMCWPGWTGLQAILKGVRDADIVHVHGLWTVPVAVACTAAYRYGRPYVITPHGMLNRWSLAQKRLRKELYAALIERGNITRAAAAHFLNSSEYQEAREFGFETAAFVVPNGVDVEVFAHPSADVGLTEWLPEVGPGTSVVLFLGRLHEKKGLERLIEAFHQAWVLDRSLRLVIAGPGEGEYRDELRRRVDGLGIEAVVTFTGEVRGSRKHALLTRADCFALPTQDEGDSVAIKEALASGLPVITTPACRLPELVTEDAGLIVEGSVESLAKAILLLTRDIRRKRSMSRNARLLAGKSFSSDHTADRMRGVYEDILRGSYRSESWVSETLPRSSMSDRAQRCQIEARCEEVELNLALQGNSESVRDTVRRSR